MKLADEVKAVQRTHGLSFERAWAFCEANRPELFVQRSVEMNRLQAKLAPEKEKETREKFDHVEAIARRLMERDRTLPFGVALERVRLCLPGVQASIETMLRQSVKAEEPEKGRTLLIRGSEGTYVD